MTWQEGMRLAFTRARILGVTAYEYDVYAQLIKHPDFMRLTRTERASLFIDELHKIKGKGK